MQTKILRWDKANRSVTLYNPPYPPVFIKLLKYDNISIDLIFRIIQQVMIIKVEIRSFLLHCRGSLSMFSVTSQLKHSHEPQSALEYHKEQPKAV